MNRGRWFLAGGAGVLLAAVATTAVVVGGAPDGGATTRGSGSDAESKASAATASPAPGWLGPTNRLGAPADAGSPDGEPAERSAGPRAGTDAWWRRVPPVAGPLRSSDGRRIGHVAVLGSDGDTLTITVVGTARLPRTASTAVLTADDRAVVELGTVTSGVRGVGFVLTAADADRLPDPVTTLELRDRDGRTVATAVLLPV
ncbi:hypothetical protein [Curtobacterium sp. DN_7.5]|uniref:hypothetical protein n=1 Tax=Curtobacterium sp. DN_7.5 TaxID=3049047 RepID=UPI001F56F585|nr:hypothetical protein [Curtobacterium sp. DN_7.5]